MPTCTIGSCAAIRPLALVAVEGDERLLVVSCDYSMADRQEDEGLKFEIATDSVSFHLFEAI